MIRTKIHSTVDVITNSSTVIYTYQDNCVGPTKDLLNEVLKLQGITDKTADDIFEITVESEGFNDWLDVAEDSWLVIKVKDEKYEKLSGIISRLLGAVSADGGYNG